MTWQHDSTTGTWKATAGAWRAVVARLSRSGDWYPYVTRIQAPHYRFDGPHCQGAIEGRAWCEAEVRQLTANPDMLDERA
jgi:hypothetical protein